MNSLLPIITRSIIGINDFINTYYWPEQLGDVIVLEIKTGVLAGSFLPSCRLEMPEMSEVSEELRVYAAREHKCSTETEVLDVLKEVEDYALDSPLPSGWTRLGTGRLSDPYPQGNRQAAWDWIPGRG